MSYELRFPCEGSVAIAKFSGLRPGAMRNDDLRFGAVFVNGTDREVYAVLGWSLESVLTGRTEQEIDFVSPAARFRSINDLAFEIKRVAEKGMSNTVEVDDILADIRAAIQRDPRPSFEWVYEFAGIGDESASAPAVVEEKPETEADAAKERVRTKRAKAKTAGEPPVLPVEAPPFVTPEPVAPAPVPPTHFRGVLLRPASDWSDPSAEGVFVGVSNEAYHDCPSFSGTAAAKHVKSPAHSRLPFDGAARSRDIGTLVHGDILEGKDAAALGFTVVEGKTTTKANTVTTDMVAIAKACAAALREDPTTALVATLSGLRELPCRARCTETGLMLRCRFDLAPEAMGWAWDVKTTSAEDPGAFDNSFGEFGYAVSGAHYLRVAALVGLPFRAMRYACVSTSAPHETWVKTFGPIAGCEELHEVAMSAAINAAKAEAHGRATGEWKKRRHEPSVAELKPWHLTALRQMANGEGVPY